MDSTLIIYSYFITITGFYSYHLFLLHHYHWILLLASTVYSYRSIYEHVLSVSVVMIYEHVLSVSVVMIHEHVLSVLL